MKCTKWYLGKWGKFITIISSVIGAAILIINPEGVNVINYYCTKDNLIGIDITQEPLSIYCGPIVYIFHLLLIAMIIWLLGLLLFLVLDGILYIFNPKRKMNEKMIGFFNNLLFRPKLKYSLFLDRTKTGQDICIEITNSRLSRECELDINFDSLRTFNDKDLDKKLKARFLSSEYKILRRNIKRGQIITVRIGEIKEKYRALILYFDGFSTHLSENGEFTYFFNVNIKCGKRKFDRIRKSVKFSFHENEDFSY